MAFITPPEPLKQGEKCIHICMNCFTTSGPCLSKPGEVCKATCPKYCGQCNTEPKKLAMIAEHLAVQNAHIPSN